MAGACRMLNVPLTASTPNHITMTGPKIAPMPAVPWRCTRNSAINTTSAMGTTYGFREGAATSMPSTALSTEMAGVMIPSPKNNAAPKRPVISKP